MIKRLILIAALIPGTASAHWWDQDEWMQSFLDNRVNIGACLKLAATDIPKYISTCDTDALAVKENDYLLTYYKHRDLHDMDDFDFIEDHWAHETDEWRYGAHKNLIHNIAFKQALITLYIVDGMLINHK